MAMQDGSLRNNGRFDRAEDDAGKVGHMKLFMRAHRRTRSMFLLDTRNE
jgi:hypothetical protein